MSGLRRRRFPDEKGIETHRQPPCEKRTVCIGRRRFPDEKGIETLGRFVTTRSGHRRRRFPDEKGIETRNRTTSSASHLRPRRRRFPDEKGIETIFIKIFGSADARVSAAPLPRREGD